MQKYLYPMTQLSYVYLNSVVAEIVQNDSRFSIINKPAKEIVRFFQQLFITIIEQWMQLYPNDLQHIYEEFHDTQIEHLKKITHNIENIYQTPKLNFQFILSFFKDALYQCKRNLSSSLYEQILLSLLHEKNGNGKKGNNNNINTIRFHTNSQKMAVIVDPRYDALMKAVIHNFMHFLSPCGWNLMIFSHAIHREQIVADFPTCLFAPINDKHFIHDTYNMSVDAYNNIFLSKSFWESIPAIHICIFQKDCIMYKMFDESIFLKYDFAGATYQHEFAESCFHSGINGGFSLRNRNTMIECLEQISWNDIITHNTHIRNTPLWKKYNHTTEYTLDTRNEDVFFTNACEILHKNLPDIIMRERLAIEAIYTPQNHFIPSVYHGWNKNYHNLIVAQQILIQSPLFNKYIYNVSD